MGGPLGTNPAIEKWLGVAAVAAGAAILLLGAPATPSPAAYAGAALLVLGAAGCATRTRAWGLAGLALVVAGLALTPAPASFWAGGAATLLALLGLAAAGLGFRGHVPAAAGVVAACVAIATVAAPLAAPNLVDVASPGLLLFVTLAVAVPSLAVAFYRHRRDEAVRTSP